MPRFMVEIHRRAYGRLEQLAQDERRTPQDQAGVMLEQILDAATDVTRDMLAEIAVDEGEDLEAAQ